MVNGSTVALALGSLAVAVNTAGADKITSDTTGVEITFKDAATKYTVTSDVHKEMNMAEDTAAIKAFIKLADFTGAEKIFKDGQEALPHTWKKLVDAPHPDSSYWAAAKAHYSTGTFISSFVEGALGGGGDWKEVLAREEGVMKGIMNQSPVMLAFAHLEAAAKHSAAGSKADAHKAVDTAVAFYVGSDRDSTPYATANKRAKDSEYATLGAGGESKANLAFLKGCASAAAAIDKGESLDKVVETIKGQVMATYYQASIKYANSLDSDVGKMAAASRHLLDGTADAPTAEHQAEGWAFWRVIEATVASTDPEGAASVTAIYNLSNGITKATKPDMYCTVKNVAMANLAPGLTAADVGVFAPAKDRDCPAYVPVDPPTGGGSTPDRPDSKDSPASTLMASAMALVASAAAAASLAL